MDKKPIAITKIVVNIHGKELVFTGLNEVRELRNILDGLLGTERKTEFIPYPVYPHVPHPVYPHVPPPPVFYPPIWWDVKESMYPYPHWTVRCDSTDSNDTIGIHIATSVAANCPETGCHIGGPDY